MKKVSIIILCALISLGFSILIPAQNPITPAGVYIADPSAHVWNDGKLYVYGSLDESCAYYCSHRHHVMVTEDMQTWTIHKDRFMSKGDNDAIPYNDLVLFAPDCAFKNDSFYLYYCQPSLEFTEGVASSSSPLGPFVEAQNLDRAGHDQIDPSVFVDDDGQAYYLWGQFTLKMAKLNSDMRSIDKTSLKDSVLTESEHFFHEGAYLTKRNNIYYMVFADLSRSDMPTCIGYATSKSVFGPYTYGGVIVDNDQCNPGNWNNHGSIEQLNGQWYVFYHRSTHGCNKMRKACVEPITFLEDGSIPEVEMTSQGASDPFLKDRIIEAEWACGLQGSVRIKAWADDAEALTEIRNGDKVVFKYINFEEGVNKIDIRLKPGTEGGRIVIFDEQIWHQKLGEIEVDPSLDDRWITVSTGLNSTKGIHQIWLQFWGEGTDLFSIDWISFH